MEIHANGPPLISIIHVKIHFKWQEPLNRDFAVVPAVLYLTHADFTSCSSTQEVWHVGGIRFDRNF